MAGLSSKTTAPFKKWINIYKNEGPSGLLDQKKNRYYSKEVKLAAVNAYLNGEGSGNEIARRFGLRSESELRGWIKVYNTHGEINCRGSGGGSYMRKVRELEMKDRYL